VKELKKNICITYLTLTTARRKLCAEKSSEYAHERDDSAPTRRIFGEFYFECANNLASKLPYFMQKYVSSEHEEVKKQVNRKVSMSSLRFSDACRNMPEKLESSDGSFSAQCRGDDLAQTFEVQRIRRKSVFERSMAQVF
jgi:hypothetical protein